jgi:hypothetical protein
VGLVSQGQLAEAARCHRDAVRICKRLQANGGVMLRSALTGSADVSVSELEGAMIELERIGYVITTEVRRANGRQATVYALSGSGKYEFPLSEGLAAAAQGEVEGPGPG